MQRIIPLILICIATIQAADIPLAQIKQKLQLTQDYLDERGRQEIEIFVRSGIWKGGYYEGDPLDPYSPSFYQTRMSYKGSECCPLYMCYKECVEPFITKQMHVLEIGPGRGTFTKPIALLQPKKITCVDALSADHNDFWQHVGRNEIIRYVQIHDFLLNEVENNSIDFVFSFGTFCHISPLLCHEYLKNLHPKMRSGAHGIIMYADYDKRKEFALARNKPDHIFEKDDELTLFEKQKDPKNIKPACYHLGKERARVMLKELGYEVISIDMGANERDPIVHFRKP